MTDHKERLEESLSALMDGETTDMEMHRLLKEIASDTSLRDKWKRYHMISATIKGETVSPSMDYSASIAAAIDAESAYRSKGFTLFAGAAGRFAIAASVAMLAVVGVQQLNSPLDSSPVVSEFAAMDEDDQNNGPAIQFPSGFQPIINARTVSVGGDNKTSRYVTPLMQVRQQEKQQYSEVKLRAYLNNAMLKHSNNAALNSNQGMLPFARLNDSQSSPE